ncbi:unnamed protein product [Calypogeia fissa]
MAVRGDILVVFLQPSGPEVPNRSQPNRSAGSGYWQAMGTDKHICCAINGQVYCKGSLRLDDSVLCRKYKKKSTTSSPSPKFDEDEQERENSIPEENNVDSSSIVEDFLAFLPEIESSKLIN